MKHKSNRLLLYCGLTLVTTSFIAKWTLNISDLLFYVLLGVAISCKILFLLSHMQAKGFKMDIGIYFILTGVGLMLLSMLFKTIFPIPVLQQILFYTAISLKITGVILKFK